MKKISMILMAFALTLTMSQCKKNEVQPTSNDEVVTITLDVTKNNSSRVVVNPSTGTVDFETGDKIYVGSGGKYVGFLTHNGTNFGGNITNPTENQPLQFYFLGNVTPTETLAAGTTEECSVIISDQTEHLPVISCAASYENYVSGVTAYSAHLLNKCALVKFNVTTPSNSPICITGMHNKVTVDFTQNTVTPSMDGDGVIKLSAGSGENVEKWAILLPQEAVEIGVSGSAFSEGGSFIGTRGAVCSICENDYINFGIEVDVTTEVVPTGAINGKFTINADGDKVYFSQGNLQYIGSANTPYWKFAENQWDYFGTTTGQNSSNQNVDRDLFGWGTSGYHNPSDPYNVNYQPWSTSSTVVNVTYNYYGYGPSMNMTSPNLNGSSANYDWGVYNPISNGGNIVNQWRTLTFDEWWYVLNTRTTSSGIRYAKAKVNNVNGVLVLPDDWRTSIYILNNTNNYNANFSSNSLSASLWNVLEQHGVIFLPAAGGRDGTSGYNTDLGGEYWSASCDESETSGYVFFSNQYLFVVRNNNRFYGHSVRLVHDTE